MLTLKETKKTMIEDGWVALKVNRESKTVSLIISLAGESKELTFEKEHLPQLIESVNALEEFDSEEIKNMDPKEKEKLSVKIQESRDRESLVITSYALKNLVMSEAKAAADVIVNPPIVDPRAGK
jgi:hypothetical protein